MPLTITCDECGRELRGGANMAGKTATYVVDIQACATDGTYRAFGPLFACSDDHYRKAKLRAELAQRREDLARAESAAKAAGITEA